MNSSDVLAQVPGYLFATSTKSGRSYSPNGLRHIAGSKKQFAITKNTKFDLASLTKIVGTTAAIRHLIELNQIKKSDFISKFFPSWGAGDKSKITITDLLTHQSGLAEWHPLYFNFEKNENAADQISKIPLKYVIRSGRHYSDLGFITLGEIVKRVTTKNLDQAFSELVFNPLDMQSTSFGPISGDVAVTSKGDWYEKNMVESNQPYEVNLNSGDFHGWRTEYLAGQVNDGNAFHRLNGIAGHAGLFSTAEDLLIFAEAILANTWSIQDFLKDFGDPMQGLGFRNWKIGPSEETFWGHTGFTGVAMGISLAHESAALLLTNRLNSSADLIPTQDLWDPLLSQFCTQIVTK